MNEITDKINAAKAAEAARVQNEAKLATAAARALGSEDGQMLLAWMIRRYGLLGRVFLAGDRGDVNALRAGVRDGERAVVSDLINLARSADENFPIPL